MWESIIIKNLVDKYPFIKGNSFSAKSLENNEFVKCMLNILKYLKIKFWSLDTELILTNKSPNYFD